MTIQESWESYLSTQKNLPEETIKLIKLAFYAGIVDHQIRIYEILSTYSMNNPSNLFDKLSKYDQELSTYLKEKNK